MAEPSSPSLSILSWQYDKFQLNYSYENKKKFDIIAAMQMAEIADEALMVIDPSKINKVATEWKDIGYFIDENGIKRLGTITKNTNSNIWKMY